jgi:uncharacterized protein
MQEPPEIRGLEHNLVEDLVNRIVHSVAPERIILFGSAARGESGVNSDLDILVVHRLDRPRLAVMASIRRALRGFSRPVDLVVATSEEIERYRNSIGLVFRPALRDGLEIYAKERSEHYS